MKNRLQPLVLNIVHRIVNDKKESNIYPAVASEHDIFKGVKETVYEILDELKQDNIIGSFDNINHIKMFYPINKENENINNELKKEVPDGDSFKTGS